MCFDTLYFCISFSLPFSLRTLKVELIFSWARGCSWCGKGEQARGLFHGAQADGPLLAGAGTRSGSSGPARRRRSHSRKARGPSFRYRISSSCAFLCAALAWLVCASSTSRCESPALLQGPFLVQMGLRLDRFDSSEDDAQLQSLQGIVFDGENGRPTRMMVWLAQPSGNGC